MSAPAVPDRTFVTETRVSFPGGRRVDADLGSARVPTDQAPAHGGGGLAPEPFQLFLASLATCAGIYVLGFCQARGLPTAGLGLTQREHWDPASHRLARIEIEIRLPAGFPARYRDAVAQAAAGCRVKKVLESPPDFEVHAA